MKKHILTILLIIGFALIAHSQASSGQLEEKLVDVGFENIRVYSAGDEYTISFENNIYAWNVRALATALDTISKYAPENARLNVVQLRFDIPHIVTKVNAGAWKKFRNDTVVGGAIDSAITVSYKTKNSWSRIKDSKPMQRSTVKFDFVFYPQFYLTNLPFGTIYEIQFNIAPAKQKASISKKHIKNEK